MTANPYTANPAWSADARYTASGATDILLSNGSGQNHVRWTITASDVAPEIEWFLGNPLRPLRSIAMQLADGDRLWVASEVINNVPFNVED